MTAVARMTDEEVRQCPPPSDEPGFGGLATVRGNLPLKAMDVHARVTGFQAHTSLRQTFVNTLGEPLEATYIFPLPDRAALTRFRLEVQGRVVEGLLKERGQARRDYDEAITAGHRAAITEEERPGVFTIRVGNILPGESATVDLALVGPLPYRGGEATFRFPLVVAPRYIPGAALDGRGVGDGVAADTDAVPDASRISPPVLLPGFPNPVRLGFLLDVDSAGLPLGAARCSLHAVAEAHSEGTFHRYRLQPGERLDRDVIFRFTLAEEAVATSVRLAPDADGQGGTMTVTVVPPAGAAAGCTPRDVVFAVDRSGSMEGWKMVAARRAVARMVDTLRDQDRFNVYAFDNSVEAPPAFAGMGLVSATDRHRFQAVEFLAKLDARGGTEMAEPLELAAQHLPSSGRDRALVLITDGQVGNEGQLVELVGKRLAGARIFTLGIDQAVNSGLLQRLANLGRGACELVESEERLDEVLQRVHRNLDNPVLTQLALEMRGVNLDAGTLAPSPLPDLFPGAPAVIMGRYRGAPEGSVVLRARDAQGAPWSATVVAQPTRDPAAAPLWARGHLRDLEDRLEVGREDRQALEQRIMSTSLKFNVLCRFTAFVAVDKADVANPGGRVHPVVQAVELPAGWSANAVPLAMPASVAEEVDEPPFQRRVQARSRGAASFAAEKKDSAAPRKMMTTAACAAPAPARKEEAASSFPRHARKMLEELRSHRQDPRVAEHLQFLGAFRKPLADLQRRMEQDGAAEELLRELAQVVQLVHDLWTRTDGIRMEDLDAVWSRVDQLLERVAEPADRRASPFWCLRR